MIEEGIFTRDMCLMDKKAAIEEFASGKTVILSGGPEDYNQIYKENPAIKLDTIAFGGHDDGTELLTGGCEYGFAVVNDNQNVNDAGRGSSATTALATASPPRSGSGSRRIFHRGDRCPS